MTVQDKIKRLKKEGTIFRIEDSNTKNEVQVTKISSMFNIYSFKRDDTIFSYDFGKKYLKVFILVTGILLDKNIRYEDIHIIE